MHRRQLLIRTKGVTRGRTLFMNHTIQHLRRREADMIPNASTNRSNPSSTNVSPNKITDLSNRHNRVRSRPWRGRDGSCGPGRYHILIPFIACLYIISETQHDDRTTMTVYLARNPCFRTIAIFHVVTVKLPDDRDYLLARSRA